MGVDNELEEECIDYDECDICGLDTPYIEVSPLICAYCLECITPCRSCGVMFDTSSSHHDEVCDACVVACVNCTQHFHVADGYDEQYCSVRCANVQYPRCTVCSDRVSVPEATTCGVRCAEIEQFESRWLAEFDQARKKVLLWERPFLPPLPDQLSEEEVLRYVKEIAPYQLRAQRFPYSVLSTLVSGLLLSIIWAGQLLLVRLPQLLRQVIAFCGRFELLFYWMVVFYGWHQYHPFVGLGAVAALVGVHEIRKSGEFGSLLSIFEENLRTLNRHLENLKTDVA